MEKLGEIYMIKNYDKFMVDTIEEVIAGFMDN